MLDPSGALGLAALSVEGCSFLAVCGHLQAARRRLPGAGNVSWWAPHPSLHKTLPQNVTALYDI